MTRGLIFATYDSSIQQLVVLARDFVHEASLSAQFLVDINSLNLVGATSDGDLSFLRYGAELEDPNM